MQTSQYQRGRSDIRYHPIALKYVYKKYRLSDGDKNKTRIPCPRIEFFHGVTKMTVPQMSKNDVELAYD